MVPMAFPPDLSKEAPYREYVGQTVYLNKEIPISMYTCMGSKGYPNLITRRGQGHGIDGCSEFYLENGYPFYLEKVRVRHPSGLPPLVECLGQITVKGKQYNVVLRHSNYHTRFEKALPFTSTKPKD